MMVETWVNPLPPSSLSLTQFTQFECLADVVIDGVIIHIWCMILPYHFTIASSHLSLNATRECKMK